MATDEGAMSGEDSPAVALERTVTEGLRRGARVRHRVRGWEGTVYFSAIHYAGTTKAETVRVARDDDDRIGNYVPRNLEVIGWVDFEDLTTPIETPS